MVETYDGYPEAAQDLVLITTTDWSRYEKNEARLDPEEAKKHEHAKYCTYGGGPMKVPSRPPWKEDDDFESPFLDASPEQVAEALRGAEGALSRNYCVVLDRQTTEDRTALLVKTKRDEADDLPPGSDQETPIVKVRETFKEANGLIASASVGVGSLVEILWNRHGRKWK